MIAEILFEIYTLVWVIDVNSGNGEGVLCKVACKVNERVVLFSVCVDDADDARGAICEAEHPALRGVRSERINLARFAPRMFVKAPC